MAFFLETLIGGLMAGMLYSLVALGFVLIYKASGVFNFAQGAMVLFAALAMARFSEWVPKWTGITNPIEAIAPAVHRAGALLLVDAVSSMGALPFDTDGWGVDVAITGSQKAWMIPPGMTMLSVSGRAWEATAAATLPRSYWDFGAMRRYQERGQTPYTPAISILYGLREALRLIEAEGLDKIFVDAGAEWRFAGCSMCLGMNPDQLKPRERCASTSNRNFEGRQGRFGRTHLVSPAMAAAAAIAGHFVDVRRFG